MGNSNTSMFVLSALGIVMLADNALASVSVIGGQLINDRNQVVTLRVAAEPLAVDEADAAESVSAVTFDAPSSVVLLPMGETGPRLVQITARGMTFIVLDHRVFTVEQVGNGFTIKAPVNKTGCPLTDQIDIVWQGQHTSAHKAINVSQNSAAGFPKPRTCPPPAKLARAAARVPNSMQSAQSSAIPPDYDAAIRGRTADGSNAVRVILSSADVSTGTVGTAFRRIMQACERQNAWCLLDPGPTTRNERRTSAGGGVQYFVNEDVRTALLEQQDHVMLVLRESETAAFSPQAAMNRLRAAGLPHVLIFTMKSLRTAAGGLVDAPALLGTDGYQAIAVAVDPGQASIDATSLVPIVAMSGVAGAEPITAAADNSCRIVVNRGSTTMLELICRASIPRSGGDRFFMALGAYDDLSVNINVPWINRLGPILGGFFVVNVATWADPGTEQGRLGIISVKVFDKMTKTTVWGHIDVIQSRK